MPYIDKNGKPVLWEEVYYANQYKKALIYYPVKAKSISGTPVPSPSVTPTPSITPTPTPSPLPTYYLLTEGGDSLVTESGDNLVWFPV